MGTALYLVSGHERRACAPVWGVPPPPLVRGPPPPYLACRARGAHGARGVTHLLPSLGGGSPLPLSPASRAQGAHAARGMASLPPLVQVVPSSPSPACRAQGVHAEVWGGSPLPPLPGCALGQRATRSGGPLSPLRARLVHALQFGGVPLLLFPLATRWGSSLPGWGVHLAPLPALGLCALLSGGPPPSSILRQRAGGGLLLVNVLPQAAR